MAGDWNVVLDYEKDNLNYKHKNNPKSQKQVQEIMTQLNLGIFGEKKMKIVDTTLGQDQTINKVGSTISLFLQI